MAIERLAEELINQIAAGEVVERPAAALRELAENALDAGARQIKIDLERGGKDLLRIADDGCGIAKEEISLALERHATSKLASSEDLGRITTLGFRGEALPSIASVSKFSLSSRVAGSDVAWQTRGEGRALSPLEAKAGPVGTRVEVASLFFNTPARRKFLKTDATELSHCLDLVGRLALVRPQVGFWVRHKGQLVLEAPPTDDPVERAAAILGSRARGELFTLLWEGEAAGDLVRWEGLVGSPGLLSRTARSLYLFVGGRPIRDRSLAHAVTSAYREVLVERKYPTVILNLRIPPEAVDVNIHPTKSEVRFRAPQALYGSLLKALGGVLEDPPWSPRARLAPGVSYAGGESEAAARQHGIREALAGFQYGRRGTPPAWQRRRPAPLAALPRAGPFAGEAAPEAPSAELSAHPAESQAGFFASLDIVGQFRNEFLICQSDRALYLIDQHAAHERIAYEALRQAALSAGGRGAQMLLVPESVELSAAEAAALAGAREGLERLGFDLEDYGAGAVVVRAVPGPLARRPAGEVLRAAAQEALELGRSDAGEKALEALCARMACHAVVRGPTALSPEQARSLLGQMDAIDFAAHCPHGRPVIKEFPLSEIERMFKRTL